MTSPDDLADGYDYALPADRIAQRPTERRDGSRLLVLRRDTGAIEHVGFRDLPSLLDPGDCVVLNDTRVIPARLLGRRPTGGRLQILLLSPVGEREWECLARPARHFRPGARVRFGENPWIDVEVLGVADDTGRRRVRVESSIELRAALEAIGHIPLPPYIRRADDADDRERYQTVYAREAGSAAAPTAGLHFTEEMLAHLATRGVAIARLTLHVGLGTFRPMSSACLSGHVMHEESFEVPQGCVEAIVGARDRGGRVVAVGTTVVRAIETAAGPGGVLAPMQGRTSLFIRSGHRFRAVDGLLTNFHLPRSSLLVLVAALAGRERVLSAYDEAVRAGYRFYSYGDAMLVL